MISVGLAARLRKAGLRWRPRPGDRFVVPDRGLDGQVFVVSDMTVEVRGVAGGQVVAFHGTTEWALDDVDLDEALWLPAEDRLRDLLGGTFRRLERVEGGHRVTAGTAAAGESTHEAGESTHEADEAADAYGLALLDLLRQVH